MLVLSRVVDQSIIIGDDIVVTLLEIRGEKCRIGITAPRQISVDRAEIRELKDRERKDGAA